MLIKNETIQIKKFLKSTGIKNFLKNKKIPKIQYAGLAIVAKECSEYLKIEKRNLVYLYLLQTEKNFSLGIYIKELSQAAEELSTAASLLEYDEEAVCIFFARQSALKALLTEEDCDLPLGDLEKNQLLYCNLKKLAERDFTGLYNPFSLRTWLYKLFNLET